MMSLEEAKMWCNYSSLGPDDVLWFEALIEWHGLPKSYLRLVIRTCDSCNLDKLQVISFVKNLKDMGPSITT